MRGNLTRITTKRRETLQPETRHQWGLSVLVFFVLIISWALLKNSSWGAYF